MLIERAMADSKYEIVKEIGVLSENGKGWRKEINMIFWNESPLSLTFVIGQRSLKNCFDFEVQNGH